MTESEWLALDDPLVMLDYLRQRTEISPRKLRLLACAFSRMVLARMPHERGTAAVELAERLADGKATEADRQQFHDTDSIAGQYHVARATCFGDPWSAACYVYRRGFVAPDLMDYIGHQVGVIVRDVFGNPFRPQAIEARWITPDAIAVAHAAYHCRVADFSLHPDRLAVLSDALEEAGCDNGEILAHLRSRGPHVRGCWALDLVLGKE